MQDVILRHLIGESYYSPFCTGLAKLTPPFLHNILSWTRNWNVTTLNIMEKGIDFVLLIGVLGARVYILPQISVSDTEFRVPFVF